MAVESLRMSDLLFLSSFYHNVSTCSTGRAFIRRQAAARSFAGWERSVAFRPFDKWERGRVPIS
jgi:hypothetical protein